MEQYPILKYEALRNSDNIGPLNIPLVPPGLDPLWPLIIEEEKRRKEDQPYSPLIIPEKPDFPPEEPKEEGK